MASERRSLPNQALDLRRIVHEKLPPTPEARMSPKRTSNRALTPSADGDALLQALLDTPLAAGDERRRPVALRSADPQRSFKQSRSAALTWFDTLLHRSSQLLMIGALLVLGYWFVNVPLRNWLYYRRAPVVRALSGLPTATAMRVAPTMTTIPIATAAPNQAQSAAQNDHIVSPQRASATPPTASATAHATAPRATEPTSVGEQLIVPVLALEVQPTNSPESTALPLTPSPTMAFTRPTITPVQLGTVSKPSPAPVQRDAVVAPPAAPGQSNGSSTLPKRLIIPALGLDLPIKEVFIVSGQWQIAEYAAGYLNGSGLPGVPGNLAISGHAGLYGAVFAKLGALNPGDDIYVDADGVRYHYRLRMASTVWPNQADVLDSTETPTMTLITCINWDTQRLVAQADFVDSGRVPDA